MAILVMFPTPVGMNRVVFGAEYSWDDVPHTRGDEPILGFVLIGVQ